MRETSAEKTVRRGGKSAATGGDEWVGLAWAAWCRGERSYRALGKQFGVDRETVKRHLAAYSRARAAELSDGSDPTAEYIDGLEADLQDVQRLAQATEHDLCKLGSYKHVTAIREKLAAARGVVTERKATEVHGGMAVALKPLLSPEEEATAIATLRVLAAEPD